MSGNIVYLLHKRQHDGVISRLEEEVWLARHFLEQLFYHEVVFDHPYLLQLHVFLMKLTLKYPMVAKTIVGTAEKWRKEASDCKSEVFLANYIENFITDEELNYIYSLCDEIKMFTL